MMRILANHKTARTKKTMTVQLFLPSESRRRRRHHETFRAPDNKPWILSCVFCFYTSREDLSRRSSGSLTRFDLSAPLCAYFRRRAALDNLGATTFYCKIGDANLASRALFDK